MQKSDLVELLTALDKGERHQLIHFWSNTQELRKEILLLVQFIFTCVDNEDWVTLNSKEGAFSAVFPGQVWVENKIPKLMSDALKQLKKYIAVQTFSQQMTEMQQTYYLQNFYEERNLSDKFIRSNTQVNQLSKSKWSKNDFYFYFLLQAEMHIFLNNQGQRKGDLNILNTLRALDEYYLIERLWYSCILLNQNRLVPLEFSNWNDLLQVNANPGSAAYFYQSPLGKLLQYSMTIFLDSDEKVDKYLHEYTGLIQALEPEINDEYISTFEAFAISYATRRVNLGHFEYSRIIFEIQKRRVESGRIYVMNGKIKASDFQSVATIGLRLAEFEWVIQFIEKHRKIILGVMPSEEYYQFNLSQYLYYIQDYEASLKILLTSNYEDPQYKFSSKILEIKVLYEMSSRQDSDDRVSDFLENKVEAAILYFFREKNLPQAKKKMGKRFADTMKRIIHADGKRDAERLRIILNDIAKAEFIAERQWLTKLTEDLIARHSKK